MLKSSKALQFLFLVGLATTVIGIPALLLFVVALKWIFLIYPAVFLGLVLLVSYIAVICMLYDDIFGSGRDRRFLEAETIPIEATGYFRCISDNAIKDRQDYKDVYHALSRSIIFLDVVYDNLVSICNTIGVPGIFNETDIDERISVMFVRLYDLLGKATYGLTPIKMFELWARDELLIIQMDKENNIIYNYDIDLFTSDDLNDKDYCYLYILKSDGKDGGIVMGHRYDLINNYNLTEVKQNGNR